MNVETDRLRDLLIHFLELSSDTTASNIVPERIGKWDSQAMVQLIVGVQTVFGVDLKWTRSTGLRATRKSVSRPGRKGVKVSR